VPAPPPAASPRRSDPRGATRSAADHRADARSVRKRWTSRCPNRTRDKTVEQFRMTRHMPTHRLYALPLLSLKMPQRENAAFSEQQLFIRSLSPDCPISTHDWIHQDCLITISQHLLRTYAFTTPFCNRRTS